MTFTELTPTDAELNAIRALIPDLEPVFGDDEDETMFSDDDLASYYSVGAGNVLRAAAYANFAIATSEALISKKIRTQDLQTDGPAVAAQLLAKGNYLMARADKDDATANAEFFQIVDFQSGWVIYPPELTEQSFA